MKLANVSGVSTGRDEHSGQDAIIVFTTRKVPRDGSFEKTWFRTGSTAYRCACSRSVK
jgi:hypothetical protein